MKPSIILLIQLTACFFTLLLISKIYIVITFLGATAESILLLLVPSGDSDSTPSAVPLLEPITFFSSVENTRVVLSPFDWGFFF